MDRYIAFRWDRSNESASAQVHLWINSLLGGDGWREVAAKPGFRAVVASGFAHQPLTTSTPEAAAIVFGSLFEQGQGRQGHVSDLAIETVHHLLRPSDAGRPCRYWGSFVAFLHDSVSGELQVLRDPCGATQCFRLAAHNVDILCASPDDLSQLQGLTLSIDWEYVRAFLVHNFLITRQTGLKEVTEVMPGERCTLSGSATTTCNWTWSPASIAAKPTKQSCQNAAEELRAIAGDAFAAWGTTYQNIAVRISGGLDSSIVANVLKRSSNATITGIHLVGRGYEAFELSLARLAAKHAGIDLIELKAGDAMSDLQAMLSSPKLPRPSTQMLGAAADAQLTRTCRSLGCDSIMTGHGGDSLFLQRSIAADVLVDYVRLSGLTPGILQTIYEASVLLQTPVWSLLKRTTAGLVGRKKWNALAFLGDTEAPHQRLFEPDVITRIPRQYLENDWLLAAEGLPPCKAEQIRGIVALRNYHPLLSHGIEFAAVQPLISQPIVEFSLRTPAYAFVEGGTDRALERHAFRDDIPEEIVRRSEKGFVNHHLTHELSQNAKDVCEFLAEGNLVAAGLVSRDRVVALFEGGEVIPGDSLVPIMSLLTAEAWVTTWKRDPKLRVL